MLEFRLLSCTWAECYECQAMLARKQPGITSRL